MSCRTSSGGGAVAPLPVAGKARTKLDAVLAAGMARLSVVPTDAPKRAREVTNLDDLDALMNEPNQALSQDLLEALLQSDEALAPDAPPVELEIGDELQKVMDELEPRDTSVSYFLHEPERLMHVLIDELLTQETPSITNQQILERVDLIVDTIRRLYPGLYRLKLKTMRSKTLQYRIRNTTRALGPGGLRDSEEGQHTYEPNFTGRRQLNPNAQRHYASARDPPQQPIAPSEAEGVRKEWEKQQRGERSQRRAAGALVESQDIEDALAELAAEAAAEPGGDAFTEEEQYAQAITVTTEQDTHPLEARRPASEGDDEVGEEDANALVNSFLQQTAPYQDDVLVQLVPGADPSKVPSWVLTQLPPIPPTLAPEHMSSKNAAGARYFTVEENRYLFWYVMNPYTYNRQFAVVQQTLNLQKVEEMQERYKSMRHRLKQVGVIVPERPPMWFTKPEDLPPYPPLLRPEDSSLGRVAPVGKVRTFTDAEFNYLYWYLFHPTLLLRDVEIVKAALHLGQVELQDRAKSLRYRTKQLCGIDVPPSPFVGGTPNQLGDKAPKADTPLTDAQAMAVQAMVARWDQRAALEQLSNAIKEQDVMALSVQIGLSKARLFRYLAKYHKAHARTKELRSR